MWTLFSQLTDSHDLQRVPRRSLNSWPKTVLELDRNILELSGISGTHHKLDGNNHGFRRRFCSLNQSNDLTVVHGLKSKVRSMVRQIFFRLQEQGQYTRYCCRTNWNANKAAPSYTIHHNLCAGI